MKSAAISIGIVGTAYLFNCFGDVGAMVAVCAVWGAVGKLTGAFSDDEE